MADSRFVFDSRFDGESEAESSKGKSPRPSHFDEEEHDTHDERAYSEHENAEHEVQDEQEQESERLDGFGEGMLEEGFTGPSEKVVQPLTSEDLAKYKAAQEKTGVIYISRIPPGMRPTKVRHLMSQYGEVGRVYLQPEDAKRTYLRKKYSTTKKVQFTEGWIEFKDKKVARSVAAMLNAQPIGGKKGTRFRDDIWTIKYLPKFKWHMLTEQIAHEAAIHVARLRVELSQSKKEQQEYLRNVELARVLDKRAERKRKAGQDVPTLLEPAKKQKQQDSAETESKPKKSKKENNKEISNADNEQQLNNVLSSVF